MPRRLNWACGESPAAGWLNADIRPLPGVDVVHDIRTGLPLRDNSVDYAVSIHGLQDLGFLELVPALVELRRVLRSGGVLRLALPDLARAIDAYRRGDAAYFYVPDSDAESIGGKLAVQMTWYGWSRSLFTGEFAEELLRRAGFGRVELVGFQETCSSFAEIVSLDDRERESLFVEAWK